MALVARRCRLTVDLLNGSAQAVVSFADSKDKDLKKDKIFSFVLEPNKQVELRSIVNKVLTEEKLPPIL